MKNISKFLELFDTFIFLFTQRPILFLHYYHHSSVLFVSWTFIRGNNPLDLFGVMFNSFVHIIMYTYYAVSLHVRYIPYKRLITLLQIVQFMTSFLFYAAYLYYYYTLPNISAFTVHLTIVLINLSYFSLFVKLFFQKPAPKTKSN